LAQGHVCHHTRRGGVHGAGVRVSVHRVDNAALVVLILTFVAIAGLATHVVMGLFGPRR